MDFKRFRRDFDLSQSDLAKMFDCGQSNISQMESGVRQLTGTNIRILIEKYGFDVISKYAEPDELPAQVTINMPKVENNSGQVNGGGGNSMNTVDTKLMEALNEALKLHSKSQEQIDRMLTIIEKMQEK